jgi:copper(I)-binding protein
MKRVGVVAAILCSLLASAGCVVTTGSADPDSADGQVGRLQLLRVAVESPGARGSTHVAGNSAALLLTIANFGETEDVLTAVSTNAARQVVLRDGDAAAQSRLQVAVPASGAAVLDEVAGPHLELSGLWEPLRGGSSVLVSFEFRDAGSGTMRVPIRRYTDVPVDRVPPPAP